MPVTERITSTQVRHEWKNISAGLAAGKTFSVENHGRIEAIVLPPGKTSGFDLAAHFKKLKARPVVPLEINRSAEL